VSILYLSEYIMLFRRGRICPPMIMCQVNIKQGMSLSLSTGFCQGHGTAVTSEGAAVSCYPPEMGSKTVIWVRHPAQLKIPYGPRSLVVTTSGLDSHSSMFWVFFGLLPEQ
jgi:hypothetical protein